MCPDNLTTHFPRRQFFLKHAKGHNPTLPNTYLSFPAGRDPIKIPLPDPPQSRKDSSGFLGDRQQKKDGGVEPPRLTGPE